MDSNGTHAKDKKSDDSDAKSKDNTPTAANTPTDTNKSPRKRRKVNHGTLLLCETAKNSPIPLTSLYPRRPLPTGASGAGAAAVAAATTTQPWYLSVFFSPPHKLISGRAFLQPASTVADL
jgi:hypothetical protein